MTKIGQWVFELCERKEKESVGRSVEYIKKTRASTGLVVAFCVALITIMRVIHPKAELS